MRKSYSALFIRIRKSSCQDVLDRRSYVEFFSQKLKGHLCPILTAPIFQNHIKAQEVVVWQISLVLNCNSKFDFQADTIFADNDRTELNKLVYNDEGKVAGRNLKSDTPYGANCRQHILEFALIYRLAHISRLVLYYTKSISNSPLGTLVYVDIVPFIKSPPTKLRNRLKLIFISSSLLQWVHFLLLALLGMLDNVDY